MKWKTAALLTCVVLVGLSPPVYGETVVLLDTFQDDTPGSPPNGPEIGSYWQLVGTHEVVDLGGGDLRLRSTDADPLDGYLIHYLPTSEPERARTEYVVRIEAGSVPVAANAFTQSLLTEPLGLNFSLYWGDDHVLWVNTNLSGGGGSLVNTGYAWNFDTDYQVTWTTDAMTDQFSLTVNGTPLMCDEPIGDDLLRLAAFSFGSTFGTTGSQLIDDVTITDITDPCDAEVTPPIVEIDQPDALTCACNPVLIVGTVDDPDGTYLGDRLEYRRQGDAAWTIAGAATGPYSGTLYLWDTTGLPQDFYFVRIVGENTCGLSSSDDTFVYLPASFGDLEIREPTEGSIMGGTICVDGTAWAQSCFDRYTVDYKPVGAGAFSAVDPPNSPYTTSVLNDPLATWDTSTGPTAVPDGNYEVRLQGTDDCGNTETLTHSITVDNTAPIAIISAPGSCDYVSGEVEIYGTADDANLRYWRLEYAGGGVSGWATISTGSAPVSGGLLGTWDTSYLARCAHLLRLVVVDDAGIDCTEDTHRVEYNLSVYVGSCCDINRDGLVNGLDVQPFTDCILSAGVCPP
jgi:hypothetical protein